VSAGPAVLVWESIKVRRCESVKVEATCGAQYKSGKV